MKILRSSKCSFKFATKFKRDQLKIVLQEYGRVCNIFIKFFWSSGSICKGQLLKPVVDMPDTWLSARLRKVAAREALDMIQAVKMRWKDKPEKITMPIHRCSRMYISCTTADLQDACRVKEFDAWLHMASIGNKIILNLPIKFHKHYNKLASIGKRLNSYIVTDKYVQFSFEIDTGPKREPKRFFGIDTGINAMASLNDGTQFGLDIKTCIDRIKRCCHGSLGQKRARKALKQRIDEIVQDIMFLSPDLIVVEKLKNLGYKSKLKRRLSKTTRRSIGIWNWRYWLERLEQACEWNRVSFRSVPPFHTSVTCPECGHIDRMNREGEMFRCLKCGHADNADVNAARNILNRFITGPYGACCKPVVEYLST